MNLMRTEIVPDIPVYEPRRVFKKMSELEIQIEKQVDLLNQFIQEIEKEEYDEK